MGPISSDLGSKAGSGLVSTSTGEHSGLRKQRRDRKHSEGGAVREGFPREHLEGQQDSAQVKKKGKAKDDRCESDTQPHRSVQIKTATVHPSDGKCESGIIPNSGKDLGKTEPWALRGTIKQDLGKLNPGLSTHPHPHPAVPLLGIHHK